jgi:hypothetical protein
MANNAHSFHDAGDDRIRLDAEWTTLNALRELIRIAVRGRENVTYERALGLANELLPELFNPDESLISKGQEPPIIREYRQMAEAKSLLQSKVIEPAELLDRDIQQAEDLLKAGGKQKDIRRRLDRLLKYRNYFTSKAYTEHQLIRRDAFQARPPHLPAPFTGDNFSEFRLAEESVLRVRMLHPDRPEHSTGADLVYEICSERDGKARLAFLQYKIWDGETLYFTRARGLADQLDRLAGEVCAKGYCSPKEADASFYRLPYCAAFLRLTDRLQSPDARLVSSGLHVPVCAVMKSGSFSNQGEKVLRRNDLHGKYVSSEIFEQLFENGMLGSDWISYAQIEALHKEHHILDHKERIIVYAQQYEDA